MRRLYEIKAQIDRCRVIVLRVDAVDSVQARRDTWRALNDGRQRVVFLSCEAIQQ